MAIYQMTKDQLLQVSETTFGAEGVYERQDLQRLLKQQIHVLSPDLMVIAEEYGNWEGSNRRIDLLCLDRDACLVIVELKRTDDGGHMELQALRYAAMVSQMTFEQLVDAHARDLSPAHPDHAAAEQAILSFLDWPEPNEGEFASSVRIILASADFSKELTTTALWLNQLGLDIRCVRMKPHKLGDTLLLDIQALIPLPETAAYQTQIKAKAEAEKKAAEARHNERLEFWAAMIDHAKAKGHPDARLKPSTNNWVEYGAGNNMAWLYKIRQTDAEVMLYLGANTKAANSERLQQLKGALHQSDPALAVELIWENEPTNLNCKITLPINGGYRSPQEQWPSIHDVMLATMTRLQSALKQHLHEPKVSG